MKKVVVGSADVLRLTFFLFKEVFLQIQVPEAARRRMREENRRRAREKGREGRKPMTELEACITHYRRKFERTVEPKVR